MSTQTITEFLEARIAEDEYDANRELLWGTTQTLTRMNARIVDECAAKRAIIKSYQSCVYAEAATDITKEFGVKLTVSGMVKGLELAIKSLAATYRDHADYREEWAL